MWLYFQSTGELWHEGVLVAKGYSGKGAGKNNPALQSTKHVGPIPRGFYTTEPPYNSTLRGPLCIPLEPDFDNEMFGRSAFLIHGDSIKKPGTASEGCIILGRKIRQSIVESRDKRLQVREV